MVSFIFCYTFDFNLYPMKTKLLFSLLFTVPYLTSFTQDFIQYFDGADTSFNNSIIIELDTAAENIWQIGQPQKIIFDASGTVPNVIVTDTLNYYPTNNVSSFTFGVDPATYDWGGILALQWKQKLDLDDTLDGAYIEYSLDTGNTWVNVFNDPNIYNFYGFEEANKDTLANGDVAFSGVDGTWKDIWLCYDFSWLSLADTLTFRFSLRSDGIDNNREGWMIDNMYMHPTWFHTINEIEQEDYILVFPNPTSGIINIQAKKRDEFHIIEKLDVIDVNGKIVESFSMVPTKYTVDIRHLPKGIYFLKIQTNIQTETFRIILQDE